MTRTAPLRLAPLALLTGVVLQGTPLAAQAPVPTAALEAELLSAPFRLPFQVTAEGAITVSLEGELVVGREGRARLQATGDFAGRAVDLFMVSDGEALFSTLRGRVRQGPTPDGLADALVVGLTRMGVLHNLARLTGGELPDHAEGGVREWVVVSPSETLEAGEDELAMDITVAGQPSGAATLTLSEDGDPLVRRQTVAFPQGEMRVTERYGALERGNLPDGLFRRPGGG